MGGTNAADKVVETCQDMFTVIYSRTSGCDEDVRLASDVPGILWQVSRTQNGLN